MKTLTISEARRRLFPLCDEICSPTGDPVAIRHRGSAGSNDAVLMSREHYDHLLERLHHLDDAFRLTGSATLNGSPDDILEDVRTVRRDEPNLSVDALFARWARKR